jgi:Tfp pilus assembly protein PilV
VRRRRRPSNTDTSGFSQVEVLVASAVLMVAVSQSLNLHGSTLKATGKAQLRDGLNAAINADLEQIRHTIASWAQSERSDGQLAYAPSAQACETGALGTALLAEKGVALPSDTSLDNANSPTGLKAIRIQRTISTSPGNNNLIVVNYTTSSDSPVSLRQQATLSIPAQGWCV